MTRNLWCALYTSASIPTTSIPLYLYNLYTSAPLHLCTSTPLHLYTSTPLNLCLYLFLYLHLYLYLYRHLFPPISLCT